jgi:hypothetical protein
MQAQILKRKTRDVSREGGDGKSGRRGGRDGEERRVAGLRTLTAGTLTGLSFMQKYRFLTIAQFGRVAGFSFDHAAVVLRGLERWGLIGWFGFVGIPGQGKAPKVYFLRRKGFDILCSESHLFADITDAFSDVQATWTPHMYHRLRIIDLLIAAEIAIRNRPHLRMVKVFVEYRMRKRGTSPARETTDFVDSEETSETKLVPDAVFIMENIETGRRAIFFVEMDMGSERIISRLHRDQKITLHYKLSQYDRYLKSLRYSKTYGEYGEFRSFILLFVTLSLERMGNIPRHVQDLPVELSAYYRFTTFDEAMGDLFGPIWKSRSVADGKLYSLVREKIAP